MGQTGWRCRQRRTPTTALAHLSRGPLIPHNPIRELCLQLQLAHCPCYPRLHPPPTLPSTPFPETQSRRNGQHRVTHLRHAGRSRLDHHSGRSGEDGGWCKGKARAEQQRPRGVVGACRRSSSELEGGLPCLGPLHTHPALPCPAVSSFAGRHLVCQGHVPVRHRPGLVVRSGGTRAVLSVLHADPELHVA